MVVGRVSRAILAAVFPAVFPAIFLPGSLACLPREPRRAGHHPDGCQRRGGKVSMFHEAISVVNVCIHNGPAGLFIPDAKLAQAATVVQAILAWPLRRW